MGEEKIKEDKRCKTTRRKGEGGGLSDLSLQMLRDVFCEQPLSHVYHLYIYAVNACKNQERIEKNVKNQTLSFTKPASMKTLATGLYLRETQQKSAKIFYTYSVIVECFKS
jgi:hypothetical protein